MGFQGNRNSGGGRDRRGSGGGRDRRGGGDRFNRDRRSGGGGRDRRDNNRDRKGSGGGRDRRGGGDRFNRDRSSGGGRDRRGGGDRFSRDRRSGGGRDRRGGGDRFNRDRSSGGGRDRFRKQSRGKFDDKKKSFKDRGMKGGSKAVIVPHRHEGIFISKGKTDSLLTKNLIPGDVVYSEKRVVVGTGDKKVEYRVWNPFRSKLGATVVKGVEDIGFGPGSKLLYLGAASGTTVSHCSDIVGPTGIVYAVEFSERSGRELLALAKKRTNIVPIIEDARKPQKYRMMVGLVDAIFSDIAQPDQSRIVALNAKYFLKYKGRYAISIKASSVDSSLPPETIFVNESNYLQRVGMRPTERISLEPYEKNHAAILGIYLPEKAED